MRPWAASDKTPSIREPDGIRADCARKLGKVEVSGMFKAVLACLLEEIWTTPQIEELQLSPNGGYLARLEGHASFDHFLGAEVDLIRNIHGVAKLLSLTRTRLAFSWGRWRR